jgi:hypothetical protein
LLEELEEQLLVLLGLLELQTQMQQLGYLRLDLAEVVAEQVLVSAGATVQLVVFQPVAVVEVRQLNLAYNLETAATVQTAWQSSQLTSKHEIRSNQFRNKHRGERRHLGWRDSMESSCRILC